MSTSARRGSFAALAVIAVLALALYFAGPWVLRHWAQNHFSQTLGQPVRLSHLSFNPFTKTAHFSNLRVGEAKTPMISVGHGEAVFEWSTLWQSGVHLARVELDSPRLHLVSPAEGDLNVTRLGADDSAQDDATQSSGDDAAQSSSDDASESSSETSSLTVAQLEASDGRLDWIDRRGETEASVSAFGIDLSLENYARGSDTPMQGEMRGELGDGTFTLTGRFGISPFTGDLDLEADGVALAIVQPWLDQAAALRVEKGRIGGTGHVNFGEAGTLGYQGGLELNAVALQDAEGAALFSLDHGGFEGVDWQLGDHLSVDDATLRAPDLTAQVSPQGALNLTAALGDEAQASGGESSGEASSDGASANGDTGMPLALGQLMIEQGRFQFEDRRMDPVVALDVTDIEGEIDAFATRSDEPARFRFEGAESDGTPVTLKGRIGFNDPLKAHLRLLSRQLTLQQFAPYLRKLAGYRIESGIADLDLDYHLDGERLSARNHIVLHRLDLGEEVDASETSLPLKNLVALLQGESGKIDLDIPIDTTIDGSRVDVSVVVWQAVTESLENLLTSPVDTLQAVINSGE
ncbi:DUF748 domain-containing protein [Salinicola halophilus]|uniref:DUF748 domain-containing protein n=1 Tax=Salinicola halophilus TaxID=184065 RepID=UPI0013A5FDD5|nr:DUF748 domain-containing protein [Salinicola halophilus]